MGGDSEVGRPRFVLTPCGSQAFPTFRQEEEFDSAAFAENVKKCFARRKSRMDHISSQIKTVSERMSVAPPPAAPLRSRVAPLAGSK